MFEPPSQVAASRTQTQLIGRLALLVLACACAAERSDSALEAGRPERCTLPSEVPSAPRNVEDVVAMLNALPMPVDVACFVEALEHPLRIKAIHSFLSAQPAVSDYSPRFFIFSDPLIMTVVPEGSGRHLLELGVLQEDRKSSLKAEIVFPVSEPIAPEQPYDHIIVVPGVTSCALCHAGESRSPAIPFTAAYVSPAFKANPRDGEVALPKLAAEARTCDRTRDAERCDMLSALFRGNAIEQEFPAEMPVCGE